MRLNEQRIRQIFVLSVVLKGIDAGLELIGGILVGFVTQQQVAILVRWATRHELAEDPNDIVANWLLHAASGFSLDVRTFYAIYLASHGVIKLVMVAGLLRNRLWAYPFGLLVMAGFMVYQIYEYSLTGSLGMLALTVFDAAVTWLIWHEWRTMRQRLVTND